MILVLADRAKNTSNAMDNSDQISNGLAQSVGLVQNVQGSLLPIIHVVAGILTNPQGQILVALRPTHVPQGGLWEFPGGKLESNETPFEALRRELCEEIDIEVIDASLFSTAEHTYEDKRVILQAWRVHGFMGQPIGKEGQQIEWIFPSELSRRPFPPANQLMIESLMIEGSKYTDHFG